MPLRMPAVPLALSEVERRLDDIRRRLNRQALVEVLCVATGAALCAAALVLGVGRSRPDAISALAAGCGIALAAILTACAVVARRRWASIERAAVIADGRAGMKERLSTALWMMRSRRTAAVLPVLAADLIDLAPVWHPLHIARYRLPAAVILPAIGILALLAVAVSSRRQAQVASAPGRDSAIESRQAANAVLGERHVATGAAGETSDARPAGDRARDDAAARGGMRRSDNRDATGARPGEARPETNDDTAPQGGAGSAPGELGAPIDAAARGAGGSQPGGSRQAGARARRDSAADPRLGEGEEAAGGKESPPPRQAGAEAPRNAAENKPPDDALAGARRSRGGNSQEAQPAPGARPGQGSRAGQGSSPDSLFHGKTGAAPGTGGGAEQAPAAAPPFKLTLGSFLASADKVSGADPAGGREAARGGSSTAPAKLSASQAADDAVRRAEIPPEYEEIIRRIYSDRRAR